MINLSFRQGTTLFVIGGYMILNWFFMLVRIPPVAGGGVPIGEILLAFQLCFLFKDFRWLPLFTNNLIFLLFLFWWALGFGRVLLAFPEHGMWAFRDASHVIESLFLWVGFVFASTNSAIDRLFVWLRRILLIGCFYSFSYPWRESMMALSPTITAAGGYPVAIFVYYVNSGVLLLWEAVRRLIFNSGNALLFPGLITIYAITVFQARTIYLQCIAVLFMLLWHRPKVFGKMSLALGTGVLALALFLQAGIEFKGRIGQPISWEFMGRHFVAIAGIESQGVVGAAKGVDQRLGWWKDIFSRIVESPKNLLFGMGYGAPLVEFNSSKNVVVREPHNSYISILARIGLIGFLLFAGAHFLLIRAWFKAYNLCRYAGYRLGQDRLFMFMVYFVLIWIFSIGEDAFEKPFLTIPYYFFWGIVLHYRNHLKNILTEPFLNNNFNDTTAYAHSNNP